jgi:hypothetical protein
MAGKIVADTLEHSTAGSIATNYVVNGSAKAWVSFNGTGTIAVKDSLNISSLNDDGVGLHDTNFTNSFDNTNYSCVSQSSYIDAASNNVSMNMFETVGLSTSSAPYISQIASGGNEDRSHHSSLNHGDLA